MKFRKVRGGGLRLYQVEPFGLVVSLCKAHPIDGGDNKYHLSLRWRKNI